MREEEWWGSSDSDLLNAKNLEEQWRAIFKAGRAAGIEEAADYAQSKYNINCKLDKLADAIRALNKGGDLCDDCPPADYPTDKTRCEPCPRRALNKEGE